MLARVDTLKPRGVTGSARGLSAEGVTAIMVEAVKRTLLNVHGDDYTLPSVLKRSDLHDAMRKAAENDRQADGVLLAFERSYPSWKWARGEWLIPVKWEKYLAHRTWRISLGSLDLWEAKVLSRMLEHNVPEKGRLKGIAKRLRHAAVNLLK